MRPVRRLLAAMLRTYPNATESNTLLMLAQYRQYRESPHGFLPAAKVSEIKRIIRFAVVNRHVYRRA